MEHLSTSFFRSFAAGSFKEHRMVFVNVPTAIENPDHVREAEAAHDEALDNNDQVKAQSAIRVLQAHQFVSPNPLVRNEITAALGRMLAARTSRDTATKGLEDRVKSNTESLATLNKRYTDAPAGAPGDAARAAVVADMRTAIDAARTELARLGGLAPADRPHNINAQITESRTQISRLNTATFLTDAQRTELQRSDVSRLDPAAAAAGGGRDLLGQSLLVKMEGLPTAVGESTFSADGVVAKFKFDAVSGKWQVERAAVGVVPLVAYAEVTAPASLHVLAGPEFTGAPNAAKLAAATRYNDMVTRLVSLNGGSRDQIVAREADRADTELTASNSANSRFFITNLPPIETELTAARATPGNPVRLEAAVKSARDAFDARKTEILSRIQAVSNLEPRPLPNLNAHLNALQTHWTTTIQNERRLLPPAAPVAAPTTAETLPDAERKSLEAFNKFLVDNAAVNGLTAVEGTRKPAIDAITTQLSTLNASPALREQGRAALDAKLATKGYAVDTIAFAPAALTLRTVSATAETLPDADRKSLEAFNKFLADNPSINALTTVEGTRKPAIDAIVAQLGTMNASSALREQGRLVLDAKLRTKGYAVDTIAFAPAALTLRAVSESVPPPALEGAPLGTPENRTALTNAINANRANLNVPAVTTALAPFNTALVALPEGPQRVNAVARLTRELGTAATPTTDGVAFQLDGNTIKAVTVPRTLGAPPAAERKERNERMSEFMKVIIELLRALLQIEQSRSAAQVKNFEQQMRAIDGMRSQMALMRAQNGTNTPQFRKMQTDLSAAEGRITVLTRERDEQIAKARTVVNRIPNGTLTVEADTDARLPVRICVRSDADVRTPVAAARVQADINFVRGDRSMSLVATTSPSAPAPTTVVPTTAFYVGSVNIDNRATTIATITNSPNSSIDARSTATTTVAPPPRVTPVVRVDTPPPPPRVTGTGPRREGSLNG